MCETKTKVARCSVCGCTEADACRVHGVGCCWIRPDLCSGCASLEDVLASEQGRAWLRRVMDHVSEHGTSGYQPCQAMVEESELPLRTQRAQR